MQKFVSFIACRTCNYPSLSHEVVDRLVHEGSAVMRTNMRAQAEIYHCRPCKFSSLLKHIIDPVGNGTIGSFIVHKDKVSIRSNTPVPGTWGEITRTSGNTCNMRPMGFRIIRTLPAQQCLGTNNLCSVFVTFGLGPCSVILLPGPEDPEFCTRGVIKHWMCIVKSVVNDPNNHTVAKVFLVHTRSGLNQFNLALGGCIVKPLTYPPVNFNIFQPFDDLQPFKRGQRYFHRPNFTSLCVDHYTQVFKSFTVNIRKDFYKSPDIILSANSRHRVKLRKPGSNACHAAFQSRQLAGPKQKCFRICRKLHILRKNRHCNYIHCKKEKNPDRFHKSLILFNTYLCLRMRDSGSSTRLIIKFIHSQHGSSDKYI